MSNVTQTSERNAVVLIIGAGIAGLSAAAELQRTGCRVLVLDKGREVVSRVVVLCLNVVPAGHRSISLVINQIGWAVVNKSNLVQPPIGSLESHRPVLGL